MYKLPDTPLTFSDYFKLNPDIGWLLEQFGYQYIVADCTLPTTSVDMVLFLLVMFGNLVF